MAPCAHGGARAGRRPSIRSLAPHHGRDRRETGRAGGSPPPLAGDQLVAFLGGTDEHRLLATVLTGALAGSEDGTSRAEEAGEAWGRYLLAKDPLARRADDDAAVEEVVELLDGQGFEPSAHAREIHMARCPFHALAESQPEVVCAVHKGLITGALSALGSDLEVEELDVFVRPDLCVARLARR